MKAREFCFVSAIEKFAVVKDAHPKVRWRLAEVLEVDVSFLAAESLGQNRYQTIFDDTSVGFVGLTKRRSHSRYPVSRGR